MKRKVAIVALSLLALAGCGGYGESHNYNAPPPKGNYTATWIRIESPGNYHTIIMTCHGVDGIYLTIADNNSATVVPNDPECVNGTPIDFSP